MGMTVGSNPVTDRSKLDKQKGDLTDKNGIPLSAFIITSTSTHDIKAVTDVIDNSIIKQPFVSNIPKEDRNRIILP